MQELPPTAQLPEIRAKYADRYDGAADGLDALLRHRSDDSAVRRPQAAPGGEPRRRRADARAPLLRRPRARLQRAAAVGARATAGSTRVPTGTAASPPTWSARASSWRTPARWARVVRVGARRDVAAGSRRALLRRDAEEDRARGQAAAGEPESGADARAGRPAGRASLRVPGRLPRANDGRRARRRHRGPPGRARTVDGATGPTSTSGWSRRPTSRRWGRSGSRPSTPSASTSRAARSSTRCSEPTWRVSACASRSPRARQRKA